MKTGAAAPDETLRVPSTEAGCIDQSEQANRRDAEGGPPGSGNRMDAVERQPDAAPGTGRWHPDAVDLMDRARRRTGLQDFGDPPVEPALSVLMESLAAEANLHRLGRFLARIHLRDLLETRLRLVDAWNRMDGPAEEELRCPIFVTGVPRSGSTFLHELLSQDPANRAPRVWEVMYPLRRAQGLSGGARMQIWRAEISLWWFRRLAPLADAVYPMRARTPHECVAIHSYTLMSQEFVSSFNVPTYEAFVDAADLSPTYAWQKRLLRYLQAGGPAPRWVLKSPDHVRSLEALWQVFPDAYIVQTHRHPLEALVSSSHLTEVLRGVFSRPQDRREIGRREAQVMADNMNRIMRFRDAHPELADRFIDVHYQELIADPVATLRRIYRKAGMTLAGETAQCMQQLATHRGRYGSHRNGRPTLAELGLDAQTEINRFADYCSHFGIASPQT